MKQSTSIFLFAIAVFVFSSCTNSEEHKHGTQEEWQHHHAVGDTAHQENGNKNSSKN